MTRWPERLAALRSRVEAEMAASLAAGRVEQCCVAIDDGQCPHPAAAPALSMPQCPWDRRIARQQVSDMFVRKLLDEMRGDQS